MAETPVPSLRFSVLLMEGLLAFFALFELARLLARFAQFDSPWLALDSSSLASDWLFFALSSLSLLLIHFYSLAPSSNASVLRPAVKDLRSRVHERLSLYLSDLRHLALLVLDLSFLSVIVLSLSAYLDPDLTLVDWSQVGIFFPFSLFLNLLLVFLVLGFILYLYRFTEPFREERKARAG